MQSNFTALIAFSIYAYSSDSQIKKKHKQQRYISKIKNQPCIEYREKKRWASQVNNETSNKSCILCLSVTASSHTIPIEKETERPVQYIVYNTRHVWVNARESLSQPSRDRAVVQRQQQQHLLKMAQRLSLSPPSLSSAKSFAIYYPSFSLHVLWLSWFAH